MNKVLNRPMFRREALRKGVLKPIKARVGQYIQQGPMMQQGPMPAQGRYSMIPTQYQGPQGRSFFYDPTRGSYLTDYGKAKIKGNVRGFGRGLAGVLPLYAGLESVSPEAAVALGTTELLASPLLLAKGKTALTTGRMLTGASRLAATNPFAAIGIGTVLGLGSGTKAYFDERKMVEDYAKANNIPVKKAMDIFNRDLTGIGGRPLRKSDIAKGVIAVSSARNIGAGGLDKKPEGPPGTQSYEQRIAADMRKYFDESKTKGRYYQDVDQLVNNVREQEKRFNMNYDLASMSPDDMMQVDQQAAYDQQQLEFARRTLTNALVAQKKIDPRKATNISAAVTEGKLSSDEIDAAATNDDVYSKVENRFEDPNHPDEIKLAKTTEEIEKKINKIEGDTNKTIDNPPKETGDQEIDEAKKLSSEIDISEFLQNPRINETNPTKVFLLKLAAGLLSGKTTKGGLAGAAEVLGAALGPAIDAQTLVKMKNDEAYRDWASTVLNYNASLYKARNDAITKTNFLPGAFQTRDGQFLEARRDKNTGEVVVVNPDGSESLVNAQMGQFYEQKQDAEYFDNLKLIADGYMSTRLLEDSISLMESQKGKTAIGASGLITNLVDIVSKLPTELKDGLFSGGTFSQSNIKEDEVYEGRGLRKYEDFEESTNRILGELEDGFTKYFGEQQVNVVGEDGELATAADVLGKLRVNARMLTYSLANSLKEKDRLTNRDLQLIEELTKTLTTGMTDDKIIAQYKELLAEVTKKNRIRISQLGVMGYTQADINGLLGSSGLGVYNQPRIRQKQEIKTVQDAFNQLMGIQ